MNRVFISYGDLKYKRHLSRIKKEASSLNRFDNIFTETNTTIEKHSAFQNALEDNYFKETYSSPRGGGYWIWKPFVILKTLKSMQEGDILLYADAGAIS